MLSRAEIGAPPLPVPPTPPEWQLTHLVVGAAGNIEGVSSFQSEEPDWLAYRAREYGWVLGRWLTARGALCC